MTINSWPLNANWWDKVYWRSVTKTRRDAAIKDVNSVYTALITTFLLVRYYNARKRQAIKSVLTYVSFSFLVNRLNVENFRRLFHKILSFYTVVKRNDINNKVTQSKFFEAHIANIRDR